MQLLVATMDLWGVSGVSGGSAAATVDSNFTGRTIPCRTLVDLLGCNAPLDGVARYSATDGLASLMEAHCHEECRSILQQPLMRRLLDDGYEEKYSGTSIESNTVWVTVIALILVTIMFEFGADAVTEAAGEELKEVVDAMMKELTILGFIGLSTFLAQQAGLAVVISKAIFDDPTGEDFTEILEGLHMTLFAVMMAFIMEVLLVIEMGKNNTKTWETVTSIIQSKKLYNGGHHDVIMYCCKEKGLDIDVSIPPDSEEENKIEKWLATKLPGASKDDISSALKKYLVSTCSVDEAHWKDVEAQLQAQRHRSSDDKRVNIRDFASLVEGCARTHDKQKKEETNGLAFHLLHKAYIWEEVNQSIGQWLQHEIFGATLARQTVEFDRLKARFIHKVNARRAQNQDVAGTSSGALTIDHTFDLVSYFQKRQHVVFEEIIDISPQAWLLLLLASPLMRLVFCLDNKGRVYAFLGFGYALVFATIFVRRKFRNMIHKLTPKHKDLDDELQKFGNVRTIILAGAEYARETFCSRCCPRKVVPCASDSTETSSFDTFTASRESTDCMSLCEQSEVPWKLHSLLGIPASHEANLQSTRANAPEFKQDGSNIKQHHLLIGHSLRRCTQCKTNKDAGSELQALEEELKKTLEFDTQLLSVLMLLSAAFVAIYVVTIDFIVIKEWGWGPEFFAILLAALIPPYLIMQFLIPSAIVDFIIATSVEDCIAKTMVHQVALEMKMRKVVALLTTLAMARKQGIFKHLSEEPPITVEGYHQNTDLEAQPNESEKMFSSELDTLFEKCDRTNSRRIGEHDFFHIVDEMGGDTLSVDDRAKAFKKIANGESTLSKEKFLTFMEKHMKPMSLDEEIENMFNSMDSDGSKTVKPVEFKAFVGGWLEGEVVESTAVHIATADETPESVAKLHQTTTERILELNEPLRMKPDSLFDEGAAVRIPQDHVSKVGKFPRELVMDDGNKATIFSDDWTTEHLDEPDDNDVVKVIASGRFLITCDVEEEKIKDTMTISEVAKRYIKSEDVDDLMDDIRWLNYPNVQGDENIAAGTTVRIPQKIGENSENESHVHIHNKIKIKSIPHIDDDALEDSELDEIIKMVDTDNDGKISVAEFTEMVKKYMQ